MNRNNIPLIIFLSLLFTFCGEKTTAPITDPAPVYVGIFVADSIKIACDESSTLIGTPPNVTAKLTIKSDLTFAFSRGFDNTDGTFDDCNNDITSFDFEGTVEELANNDLKFTQELGARTFSFSFNQEESTLRLSITDAEDGETIYYFRISE